MDTYAHTNNGDTELAGLPLKLITVWRTSVLNQDTLIVPTLSVEARSEVPGMLNNSTLTHGVVVHTSSHKAQYLNSSATLMHQSVAGRLLSRLVVRVRRTRPTRLAMFHSRSGGLVAL